MKHQDVRAKRDANLRSKDYILLFNEILLFSLLSHNINIRKEPKRVLRLTILFYLACLFFLLINAAIDFLPNKGRGRIRPQIGPLVLSYLIPFIHISMERAC